MNIERRLSGVCLGTAGTAMAVGLAAAIGLMVTPASAHASVRTAVAAERTKATDPRRGPDAYIYVGDADKHKIYVYPVGVANPAPLNVISVPGIPGGMTVADDGNLFVAVNNELTNKSEIMIYSAGGRQTVGKLASGSGLTSIRDVAFDAAGNLYVSCENAAAAATGVMEFSPSTQRSIAWYPSPTSQNYGITIDDQDNLFVDLGFYGTAIEFSRADPSVYTVAAINGAPTAGGIVFSGSNLIMTGGTGLWIFSPSPPPSKFAFTLAGFVNYGVGHGTGYLARGQDGTLYVPVFGSSGGDSTIHEVRVYSQRADKPGQYNTFSKVSSGLQEPTSVAVGPR